MQTNISKPKNIFADYFIVIMIIYISAETILFGTNANTFLVEIQKNFSLFLCLFLLYKTRKRIYCSKYQSNMLMIFLVLFSVFMILSGIFNNNLIAGYGLRIIIICAGFLFVTAYSQNKFMYIYERIIYVITVFSLILYLINMLLPSLLSILPIIHNWQSYTFHNAFLCVIPAWSGDSSTRLWGPFREPGVFQMYINIALLFSIKLNNGLLYKKALVYIAGILLTFSTTGYFVLFFTLLYYLFDNEHVTGKFRKRILFAIMTLAVILMFTYTTIFSSESIVFGKLSNENSSSHVARVGSLYGNLDIFLSSPIFGVGITQLPGLFAAFCSRTYGIANTSNTSTVFVQFATFGIFYGTLWVLTFLSFFKSFSTNKISIACICIAELLSFMGENLTENVMVYILLGYGIINMNRNVQTKMI